MENYIFQAVVHLVIKCYPVLSNNILSFNVKIKQKKLAFMIVIGHFVELLV